MQFASFASVVAQRLLVMDVCADVRQQLNSVLGELRNQLDF